MSLEVFIALRAEQDMTLQSRWYLENADLDVAERYLLAVPGTSRSESPTVGRDPVRSALTLRSGRELRHPCRRVED